LLNPNRDRPNLCYEFMGVTRVWRWTKERMEKAAADGLIVKTRSGMPRFKRYLDEQLGVPIGTVWTDIPPVNARAKELIGYPTQKPIPLVQRIINASSNPGDIVLDAFCGCGTTIEAAENLGRQWIGVDISPTACKVVSKRISDRCKLKDDESLWLSDRGFVVKNLPWTPERLKAIPSGQFQDWAIIAINGIPNPKKVGDMGIDGKLYAASAIQVGGLGAAGEQLEFTLDLWYPVQVKQKDKVGRPDIDAFQAVMRRTKSPKGIFVGFEFTRDAMTEIRQFKKDTGTEIIALTVGEILKVEDRTKIA
jgi:methylase of polypeptide subunit release factors